MFDLVACQHKCLEHLLNVFAELVGDMLCAKVGFVDLVRHKLVFYFGAVKQTRHIGLSYSSHIDKSFSVFYAYTKIVHKVERMDMKD